MRFGLLKTLTLATILSTAFVQLGSAEDFKKADINVQSPWVRATPTTAKVAGGYAIFDNGSAIEDHLVSITSPVSDRIEIHEMSMDNQVMRMRKLSDPLAIPANGKIELKPGSYHIMFFDLKKPFKQGDTVPATLHFEKAGSMDIKFAIAPIGAKSFDETVDDKKNADKMHDMEH